MTIHALIETARKLVGDGRGLLAMDESNATCNKRFAALGIEQTEPTRRDWRELLITTPGLADSISGAILYAETIHQETTNGTPFVKALVEAGIIPGIKVDIGAKPLAGYHDEKVTEGLDGLRERLKEYRQMGARFAKWRAVLSLSQGQPSPACIEANAHALARYAALCHEADIVPIIEPEVLMDGTHGIDACQDATSAVLQSVFEQLNTQGVVLEAIILKPNMIAAGLTCDTQPSLDNVAATTVVTLLRHVPASVAGIAFLSGGQSAELASTRLNAMNVMRKSVGARVPWPLVFSYGRAIQQPALEMWHGEASNIAAAQRILVHRATCNHAAINGEYNAAMEL